MKKTDIVWTEKYRPRKLDDIVGQDDIVKRLRQYVINRTFPHLLFTGNPGTGKTTMALVLAREIFGNDYKLNFKELNSSDSRGIDTVRNDIKSYASTSPIGQFPFKILLLDECDNLTLDAQSALRRTMERYSADCKFVLSCNYSSKIIEPIQSRTSVYRFKGIQPNDMKKRLSYISNLEGLIINDDVLNAIVYIAEGDLRKAVNTLEVSSLMGKNIDIDSIYRSSGFTIPENIIKLIKYALKGSFQNSIDMLDILIFEEGLNSVDIIKQMFKEVLKINLDEKMKIDCIDQIGETDFRISEGADEIIQMKVLITQLIKIGK